MRIARAAAVGAVAAIIVAIVSPWWLIPLAGWDVTALVFLCGIAYRLAPLNATETAALAQREDPSRPTADLLLIGASLVSLLAVGLVLVRASREQSLDKGLLVGASVLSIVLAWSIVHTVYGLRYASCTTAETGRHPLQRGRSAGVLGLCVPVADDRDDVPGVGHDPPDEGGQANGAASRASSRTCSGR